MQAYHQALTQNIPLLLFLVPIFGAGVVALSSGWGVRVVRRLVLINVLLTLALAGLLVVSYDRDRAADRNVPEPLQMVSSFRWVAEFRSMKDSKEEGSKAIVAGGQREIVGPDIRLAVGVDGLSLWLIVLTPVLMLPAVLAGRDVDRKQPATFYSLILLLEASMIGVFAALDVVFFVICLEASELFLFFLIGSWGAYDRRRVLRKFLVCNIVGSLLILLGLMGIVISHFWMTGSTQSDGSTTGQLTFSIPRLVQEIPLAIFRDGAAETHWKNVGSWIFLTLLLGFAIKLPAVPFHTWMPETNNEAPAAVSMLFVGVILKVGGYGFLRIMLPLFPEILSHASGFLQTTAVCGLIFSGLLTLGQDDVKKVTTYAGIAQLALCAAATVSVSAVGVLGGLLQLVSHGLAAGGLLFLVGVLDRHYKTRDIEAFSGLARKYPILAFFLAFFTLSLIGIPGLGGFPGEWMLLMGVFQGDPGGLFAALAGMLLVAWALVWMLQRMLLGQLREPSYAANLVARNSALEQTTMLPRDLPIQELLALAPVGVMLLGIGLCPNFFLSRMEPSVTKIMKDYDHENPVEQGSRFLGRERRTAALNNDFDRRRLAARED